MAVMRRTTREDAMEQIRMMEEFGLRTGAIRQEGVYYYVVSMD